MHSQATSTVKEYTAISAADHARGLAALLANSLREATAARGHGAAKLRAAISRMQRGHALQGLPIAMGEAQPGAREQFPAIVFATGTAGIYPCPFQRAIFEQHGQSGQLRGGRLTMREPGNLQCSDGFEIFQRDITCSLDARGVANCDTYQRQGNGRGKATLRRAGR